MKNKTNDEILKEVMRAMTDYLKRDYPDEIPPEDAYGDIMMSAISKAISLTRADDLKKFKELIKDYFDKSELYDYKKHKIELLQKAEEELGTLKFPKAKK